MLSWLAAHPLTTSAFAAAVVLPTLWRWLRPLPSLQGAVVYITGGSEGIGLSLAAEVLKRGATVVLFARTKSKLETAAAALAAHAVSKSQKIGIQEMDVSSNGSVQSSLQAAVEAYGVPDVLIPCAGKSEPGYFMDSDVSVFENTMNLNYMGAVRVVKEVVPLMAKRGHGRIMLISSAAGICSFIGYSSYSPTKFALRGFGDALRNELKGFGIQVSMCYPPDTETPGFREEEKKKPAETKLCFPADPFMPEQVASKSIDGMLRGDYHIQSPDFLQNLLVALMSGVTPRTYFAMEALMLPLLALVASPFVMWFDYQSGNYAKREKEKWSKRAD